MKLLAFKIECVSDIYLHEEVFKICEIPAEDHLTCLSDFILDIFDFDNDHLRCFFIARNPLSSKRNVIDDGFLSVMSARSEKGKSSLFMHYDYGDGWTFKLSNTRRKVSISSQKTYPCVVRHVGKTPRSVPIA